MFIVEEYTIIFLDPNLRLHIVITVIISTKRDEERIVAKFLFLFIYKLLELR